MFTISIGKAETNCPDKITLTSGMVKAVQVAFNFSDEWEGFIKTAIFSNGSTTTDVPLDKEDKCYIPHEVLAVPGEEVTVGVYGCKGEGDDYVAIPTEKQSLGEVIEGVDPLGEEPKEPTPTVWDELKIKVENMYSKEEINELLAQKDPSHGVAKAETKPISLVGITTSSKPESSTITENQLTTNASNGTYFYIDYQGEVEIECAVANIPLALYVDDVRVLTVKVNEKLAWSGTVSNRLSLRLGNIGTVTFDKFIGTVYTDGLMTGKQAEKLENTYTKEESHELFAENKVASATTKETTLEELKNEGNVSGLGEIVGNKWTTLGADSLSIDVQGKVSFNVAEKSENMEIKIDGVAFEGSEFNGIVQDEIWLYHSALSSGFIEFSCFSTTQYNGGLMSREDKKKLENTPTTEEVNNLITEAFGTVEAVFDEVHEYAESLGGDEA